MNRKTKHVTGRLTFAAVVAGCIFFSGSAMAGEQQKIIFDSASIQQVIDQVSKKQQKQLYTAPVATTARQFTQQPSSQIDPIGLQQQIFSQGQIGVAQQQQQMYTAPAVSTTRQATQPLIQLDPAALQQKIFSQEQKTTTTGQIGSAQLNPAIQRTVNNKMLQMMEKTMKESFSDPEMMQEMQQKIMAERMNSNFLQESMQPTVMENMRGFIKGGSGGK